MKTFSLKYKLVALMLVFAFTFQTMESINEHTYSTGINNYHVDYSCTMNVPTHLAIHCNYYNCNL